MRKVIPSKMSIYVVDKYKIIKSQSVFFILPIHFCLCWVFFVTDRLSLVAENRGYSPVVVCRLLVQQVSLITELGLQAHGLQLLQHAGSVVETCGLQGLQALVVVVQGLNSSEAYGIFPGWGSNQVPCHVLCIGRQILIYCTTREVQCFLFLNGYIPRSGITRSYSSSFFFKKLS